MEEIKIDGMSEGLKKALFPDTMILLGYTGSISHGTYIPQSDPQGIDDIDLMGININSGLYYLGFGVFDTPRSHRVLREGIWDSTVYEIRKFAKLLMSCNPNVLGLLWLKEYIYLNEHGKTLINNRDLFSSKRAFHSFNGYATSQLYRFENHIQPKYKSKDVDHKRVKLEEQYGYDTKSAAHCLRLLKMGKEFVETGVVNVSRIGIDAEHLMDIKKGKFTIDDVKEEIHDTMKEFHDSYLHSPLPDKPNDNSIEKIVSDIIFYSIVEERHYGHT